jgi:glutaredoxin-related protein
VHLSVASPVLPSKFSDYKVSIPKSLLPTMFSRIMNFDQVYSLFDQYLTVGIKEYSEWPTVPQLYVNGEFVGGCDIVMNMHQSGELEKVLEGAGVLVPAEEAEEHAAVEGEEVLVGQSVVEDIGVIQGDELDGKKT